MQFNLLEVRERWPTESVEMVFEMLPVLLTSFWVESGRD